MALTINTGQSSPLGATILSDGVNFSLFTRGTGVALLLLDPYGLGVAVPSNYSRQAARKRGDNTAQAMKSVVVDPRDYDWEGDAPLRRPSSQTIIYEMHVRGFTRHPSSGLPERTRGTYSAFCRAHCDRMAAS